ncbi:Leucyl aminopeptidase (aminopeptidase T) [Bhargavaea ginsengi]|uniref:Leucyl aminopeptidase (Aminopeptidase T) n=1 Tax=Bhargavaea ginsengi TaxID=426757 RepID=A0A1H7B692_9BACL|nr:aminopeptidase [Bhargavaea ginsengi]MCM3087996.1 aminopeptidase [Bhargavaea ginsengi]SEJ68925.1 Leucyl aminopeptidase (aminopeptidase T) [Bhargavaea ginsengi]
MGTFEENLDKYAELAVKVGVNIQPGQPLYIGASTDSAEFVRLVTKKAYEAGARHVFVDWSDDEISRLRYELAPEDSFSDFPSWIPQMREELVGMNAAFMNIVSQSPDLLKGVDPMRIASFQKAAGQALESYRQAVQSDKVSWTVIAAPSKAWAAKVFADLPEEDQVPALWEAIFKAVRADVEDPVEAWKKHDETLHEKADHLNKRKYTKLHYTAPGTDLTIGLPEGHIWAGAGSINAQGASFMANMPTEEVFTVPHKDRIDGFVSSTKPLSYGGNIIDQFKITFKDGRITEVEAEQGEDVLKHLIEADEGAKSLGEVALVPHSSPISTSGLLFYNTLFDENASNHLAIGSAYAFCIEGGKEMNSEELKKHGLNQSITHVDFMIGSDKMDIDGILEDGTAEPILRGGEWAF